MVREIPQEWVEKAVDVIYDNGHSSVGCGTETTTESVARDILAAVLPDVRRQVAEEIIRDAEFLAKSAYGDEMPVSWFQGMNEVTRIAREVGDTP